MESRSLDERGLKTSKRPRKLQQALGRLHHGKGDDIPEWQDDDVYAEFKEADDQSKTITPSLGSHLKSESSDPKLEELKARVAGLERSLHGRRSGDLEFRIGDKGGVSVYGLGRFPATLYYDQWVRLLGAAVDLRTFLELSRAEGKLKIK